MSQRIPAHEPDPVFVKRLSQLALRTIRVRFHLDKLRNDLPLLFQLLQILPFEVGNADGLCLSFPDCLFQLTVAGQPVACRLMDIEQVHIFHAQSLQGLLHRMLVFILTGPELCGQKNLAAADAAFPHAAPAGALIDIGIGRIHQGIAHPERFPDAILRLLGRQHKGSDSDDRTGHPVIQCDGFHRAFLLTACHCASASFQSAALRRTPRVPQGTARCTPWRLYTLF